MESDTGNTTDAASTTEVDEDEDDDDDGLLYKSGSEAERDGNGRDPSSEYDDVDYI